MPSQSSSKDTRGKNAVKLIAEKAMVDKALSEMRKQGGKMQEEWKKEKARREMEQAAWEGDKMQLKNKINALGAELQQIKDMPTSLTERLILLLCSLGSLSLLESISCYHHHRGHNSYHNNCNTNLCTCAETAHCDYCNTKFNKRTVNSNED